MAIPESQLETWAKQGSITGSSTTYNHIKGTLEASDTPFADKEFTVFLQGSYGNDTNIYSESDVDVVIQLETTFQQDLSALTETAKTAFHKAYANATYTYSDFKRDVVAVLTDAYGDNVKAGKKAIMVPAGSGRRKADVIVAIEYRRYLKFNGTYDEDYIQGIVFYTSTGEKIINYPKPHSKNLTAKHQGTERWLKPMVRVLKNMRSRLVAKDKLNGCDAPSYYLEGLLYNVPSEKFDSSYGDTFCEAINWLNKTDRTQLVCANEQYYLLGSGSHVCWEPANCDKFLSAVSGLWTNW
ncbi:MAG TPA: nucleotidyltransferase [Pirellulales bacterium]|nr:nucleotidyltransferase [Pirellulales bacterium]